MSNGNTEKTAIRIIDQIMNHLEGEKEKILDGGMKDVGILCATINKKSEDSIDVYPSIVNLTPSETIGIVSTILVNLAISTQKDEEDFFRVLERIVKRVARDSMINAMNQISEVENESIN